MFGILTGLAPGIHPNTVVVGLLALSPFLLSYTSPIALAVFITTVATVNTFTDAIPSAYLGAPEESTALGVLPMHRYLLQGKGHEAIMLTVIGGIFALILSILIIPILVYSLKQIFPYLQKFIPYLLIFSVIFLLLREKKKFLALVIFLLSGTLGIITLNFPNLPEPLFPLFSGLFGISTLLISLNTQSHIPHQTITFPRLTKKEIIRTTPAAVFSGGLVSTLPALSTSPAAILGSSLIRKITNKEFLIMIGGINTVNFVLSFVSLYVLDKARNGAVVGISQIIESLTIRHFILFIAVCLISSGLAAISTIYLSKVFSKYIMKINYQKLVLTVIASVMFLVLLITGIYGFLIMITGTFIGMIPTIKNVGKTHLMGSLMLPVILFYFL